MSAHRSHYAAAGIAVLAFAGLAAPQASASPWEPDPGSQTSPLVPSDWPDEGMGYPGYADEPFDWPDEGKGWPGYADQPTGVVSTQRSALDVTSVALGALGGIALGGAGLGISLAVQRRRDHASLPGESA
jgi:hypothetical protein